MGYDTATHEMTSRRVFPAVTLTLLALLASMGPVPVAGQAPDSRPRLPRPSGPHPGMLNPPKPPKAVAPGVVYDEGVKQTLPAGHWVYTGPRFVSDSKALLADVEGVLIGFVHTPATLIERVEPVPGPYGNVKLNPALGLTPGTPVLVTVRALPRPGK